MNGVTTVSSPAAASDNTVPPRKPRKPRWRNCRDESGKQIKQRSSNSKENGMNNKTLNERQELNKQRKQLNEKQREDSFLSRFTYADNVLPSLSGCHARPPSSSLSSLSSVPVSDKYCNNNNPIHDISYASDCATASTASISDSNSDTPKNNTKNFNRKQRRRKDMRKKQKQNNFSNMQGETPNNSRMKSTNSKKCSTCVTEEEKAKYIAMDCEMVGVGIDGQFSALARVSLVDWNNGVLLDTHVKVSEPVIDLRTFVSGVTLSDIDDSDSNIDAMDFHSCVNLVRGTIQDKILVGHGLKNDLRALGITHPWQDIRDTAKYEPFMNNIFGSESSAWGAGASTRLLPRKLKHLAKEKLNLTIQQDGHGSVKAGHCSIEDATAAMQLYQLERTKWEKVIEYKINRTREIEDLKHTLELMEHIQ